MTEQEYETLVSTFDASGFVRTIEQDTDDIEVFWKNFASQNPTADVSVIRKGVEDYDIELDIEAEVEWTYRKSMGCRGTSDFTLDWDSDQSAESQIDEALSEDVEDTIFSRGGRRYLEEDAEADITREAVRYRFTLGDITPPSSEEEAA